LVRAPERVPTAAARVGLLVRAPERVPTAAARVGLLVRAPERVQPTVRVRQKVLARGPGAT